MGTWSTDDAFVGLLLAPYRFLRVNDRRWHEAPGAGAINAWPASRNSAAVAGLRHWAQFQLLKDRDFEGFNARGGVPGLAHHAGGGVPGLFGRLRRYLTLSGIDRRRRAFRRPTASRRCPWR